MKHFLIIIFLSYFVTSIEAQETIKDVDGNLYHVITIGKQKWMVENLKVTHYNNGAKIPLVMNETKWSILTTGAYCVSEKKTKEYLDTYGVLYNFHAVADSQKLCPVGWHVPTALEWKTLIEYLGGSKIAGGKMKDFDSGLWKISVEKANNSSQFSALPSGGRGQYGNVDEVGYYATWWSSTSEDANFAWHWGLHPDKNEIRFNPGHKNSGFSVRCIKDN